MTTPGSTATCRWCGQTIYWARAATTKGGMHWRHAETDRTFCEAKRAEPKLRAF